MKKLITILIVFNVLFANATNYYVSWSGNDANPGTISLPWKSVSKVNGSTLTPGDSVLFRRGDYFYGTLTINNSGTPNKKIYVGAYGYGANPAITGLATVTSWTSIGNGLYTYNLPVHPTNSLNLVTFQDAIQPMGRYPRAGNGDASYFKIDGLVSNSSVPSSIRTFTSKGIAGIPNLVGSEMVQRTEQWVYDKSIVTSQTQNQISYLSEISPDHPTFSYPSKVGHGFFFQNHISTCTQLGDWAYNNATHTLTMYFGSNNPASYTVQVATLDSLFSHNQHSNITLENLCFKGANANIIELDYASGIRLNNDSIILAGQNGVDVSRADDKLNTNHNTITNCVIKNCLNNGLNLVESTNWQIDHNHIENIGRIQGMGLNGDGQYIGVFKVGANSICELNEVDSIGYNAVWYTGNNTIVRKNHIHDYCMIKSDGGGVYSYGNTGSNIHIDSNIIHDGKGDLYGMSADFTDPLIGQIHGIYNDGNVNGVTETHNTVFNNSSSGIWFGSNSNIIATNNLAYNNTAAQFSGNEFAAAYSNVTIKNNVLFSRDSIQLIHQFLIPLTSFSQLHLDSNVYCRPTWQPSAIDNNGGYQFSPFSWGSYHDGGIIETTTNGNKFYSLEKWQAYSGADAHSGKYCGSYSGPSDILFQYNATNVPVIISLSQNYIDPSGVHYIAGPFTLQPYTSLLLVKDPIKKFSMVIGGVRVDID